MFKNLKILIIICLLVFVSRYSGFSQASNCNTCPKTTSVNTEYYNNGYDILLGYSYCDNNDDGLKEIDITSICIPTITLPYTLKWGVHTAIMQALWEMAGLYYNQSPYQIVVKVPSCWELNGTIIAPSSQCSGCCSATYTIFATDTSAMVQSQVIGTPTTLSCESPVGYTCEYICDALNFGENQSLAQPFTICSDDCPGVEWEYADNMRLNFTLSGNYTMWFMTKTCPDQIELYITKIKASCNSNDTYDDVIHEAIDQLLFHFMRGNPNTPYKLYMSSCWHFLTTTNYGCYWLPCNIDCCSALFSDITPQIPYSSSYNYDFTYTSSSSDCGSSPFACYDACSILQLFDGSNVHNKTITKEQNYNSIIINPIDNSYIIPNPNSGQFDLHFISQINGLMQIKIYNSEGGMIDKYEFNKQADDVKWKLNLSNNITGAYYYTIEYYGKVITNGNFIIKK